MSLLLSPHFDSQGDDKAVCIVARSRMNQLLLTLTHQRINWDVRS